MAIAEGPPPSHKEHCLEKSNGIQDTLCARLHHVAATNWGARRYMNMDHLFKAEDDLLSDIIAG